jgi:solute:Na+ symporter, SSS family
MLGWFVVLYFCITLVIGYLGSRRKQSTVDFALASRSMPGYITAFALFATWYGSETILGASSEFLKHGLHGILEDPFGAALCLLLVGLFYVRPLYRMGYLSLGDFIRDKFGARNEKWFSILLVISYLSWIGGQFAALGILLELLFQIPFVAAVFIAFAIVSTFTLLGGMWAISITDFFQSIVIIGGMSIALFFLVDIAGGWETVWQAIPEGHFSFLPAERSFQDYLYALAALLTLGLGSIPSQDIFQRLMTARSERAAVQATFAGAGMYLVFSIIPLLIAVCALSILQADPSNFNVQQAVPKVILTLDNLWVKILFFGALISAVISTASATLLAPAVVLGENIIKPLLPEISDKKLLSIIRLSIVSMGLLSLGMSLWKENIFELVALSSSFTLVCLFVPLTFGLFKTNATAQGCSGSMLIGLIGWFLSEWTVTAIPPILVGLVASLLGGFAGDFLANQRISHPK